MIIWKNSDDIFFEFNIKISDEFRQDLEGVHNNPDILKDLIIDYPKNNKEVSLEYLQERYKQSYQWSEELNKKLLPYIRNEKLNKLIN
jgi:IS4 transposase